MLLALLDIILALLGLLVALTILTGICLLVFTFWRSVYEMIRGD